MSYTDLWRWVARYFHEMAVSHGYSGTLEPNGLDSAISSMRKACFYTAFIVDNP